MAYAQQQGLLKSQTAPFVSSGVDALTTMTQVLGAPQQQFPFDPDQTKAVEVFTLQKLMEGKAQYNGITITSMMQSSNPQLLRIFPTKRTNALTHIDQFYDFPKEFAVETSPGAAPGYVRAAKSERSTTLTQYNLGATTTVQELRTQEGQFLWIGKLTTVAIGFLEVAEMLVVRTLLTVPSFYAQYYLKTGYFDIDLQATGRIHDVFFDILHRHDNGMAELVNAVRQDMSKCNIMPTHVIMSEGMRGLIANSPLYTEYFRNGPGASQNAIKLADAIGAQFDTLEIVTVRALNYREKRLDINLLERCAQIGENFRIDHFWEDCDLSKWCSNWMTIAVYNLETDNWANIGLQECIANSGRFHGDGRLSDHHNDLAKRWRDMAHKAGVPVREGHADMFLYHVVNERSEATTNVARIFGHMERWALSDETVDRTAATIVNYLRRVLDPIDLKAIGDGLDDIAELYERPVTDGDVARWTALNANGNGRFGVPTLTDAGVRDGKPAGYGSVAGYLEISQAEFGGVINQDMLKRAKAFKSASIRFHKAFETLFGRDHVALNPKNAPLIGKKAGHSEQENNHNSFINFFQNIVDNNKSPVHLVGDVRARPVVPTNAPEWLLLARVLAAEIAFVTPSVHDAFATEAASNAFAEKYAKSEFATKYAEGTRSAATRRRVVSADVDGDAAVHDRQVTWLYFVSKEFAPNKATPIQQARLLSHVVNAVNRPDQAPAAVTADVLNAWRGPDSIAGDDAINKFGGVGGDGNLRTPASANRTAFVASHSALAGTTATLSMPGLAGAAWSGRDPQHKDGSGSNNDFMRLAFSGAHMAEHDVSKPGADGVRRQPDPVAPSLRSYGSVAMTPFAQAEFTDIAGPSIVVNTNITERYRMAGSKAHWALRVAAQMFILAPITRHTLEAFRTNDVAQPVSFLLQRPFRRYRTVSFVFLSKPSAGDIGNVLVMDPDAHFGRNAIRKDVMLNASMYMGVGLTDSRNWYVSQDTAVVGYDGGENTKFFDPNPGKWNIEHLSNLQKESPSMLCFMEPAGCLVGRDSQLKVPPTHDIRGFRDAAYYQGNSVHRQSQWVSQAMHPSALFYTTLMKLNKLGTATVEDWATYYRPRSTFNTTTHQGHQWVLNPHTGQLGEKCIMSQDQFKDSVYPGCRDLRLSFLPRHYKKMDYESKAISA